MATGSGILVWREGTFDDHKLCLRVSECAQRFMLDDLQCVVTNCLGSKLDEKIVWEVSDAAYLLNKTGLKRKV